MELRTQALKIIEGKKGPEIETQRRKKWKRVTVANWQGAKQGGGKERLPVI